jgi:methanogenic corrinoid protein MtbC1
VDSTADGLGTRRDAYLAALLARDQRGARAVVAEALADGASPEDLYLQVFQPALQEVGHRWALGDLSVADEHLATAVTHQLLDEVSPRMRTVPWGGRLAVVSSTPDELHALGARMVADFLEADGWEVLQLGAATPADDLVALVEREAPDMVALSTTTPRSLPGIADVLQQLRRAHPRPLIVVGGQFWTPEAARTALELGADVVERDPRTLVAILREKVPPRQG